MAQPTHIRRGQDRIPITVHHIGAERVLYNYWYIDQHKSGCVSRAFFDREYVVVPAARQADAALGRRV